MDGGSAPTEGCRPASPADVPRLAELAALAVAELREAKGGEVWQRTDARQPPYEPRLEAEVSDPEVLVLAGTIDDAVIGYAVARLRPLADGGRIAVLDDLFVEPGARAVGVGDVLLEACLSWCEEQGCSGIDSLALPGDRHTKNFFEAHGMVARAIVVHRRLPS
jgi:GNAT superfamily N-acetyltransferase